MTTGTSILADTVARAAIALTGASHDYDPLLDLIGDACFICLGEASHGTREFYRERVRITRRLIEERGFNIVGIEGDWPDAYRASRYAQGVSDDDNPNLALSGFERFPAWMWRNEDVLDFIEWLREHNATRESAEHVGFYGLDLYSLYRSIDAVLAYLDKADPDEAALARRRYSCFEYTGRDAQLYGVTAVSTGRSCEDAAVAQLSELCRDSIDCLKRDRRSDMEDHFYAVQNARVVVNAERYYRTMYRGGASTWNLRDTHMADTVDSLVAFYEAQGRVPKVVVWAHNSHIGDARATQMGYEGGELNVGQLMRQRHGDAVRLIGFSTYSGTVTAASDWGAPPERKTVRQGMSGSFEELFHDAKAGDFMLRLDDAPLVAALDNERLERAIGVIYRPETERQSHYFYARLADQFDAVLHFDRTNAVIPLEVTPEWVAGEVPATFPTAL